MLSGRSTVVAAPWAGWNEWAVVAVCRERLGLADDGSTMELWHGSEMVPAGAKVPYWPGVQPCGRISEYLLLLLLRR
eukprot:927666-Amphidinium_carterae.1